MANFKSLIFIGFIILTTHNVYSSEKNKETKNLKSEKARQE